MDLNFSFYATHFDIRLAEFTKTDPIIPQLSAYTTEMCIYVHSKAYKRILLQ